MKTLFTLCAFFLLTIQAFSQNYNASGQLTDSLGKPVQYASVALRQSTDSSLVQFIITKDDGSFQFKNLDSGHYIILAACFGFDVAYYELLLNENQTDISIILTSSVKTIDEILIVADVPVMMNGDTIIYNSSSFKTQSNATVEDLIKKLPGIQINKDGTISAEGQNITKVLINGEEFFGGNVEAATKNLDASIVDKVEVIDKKTDDDEFTGEDGNEREKVINLVLKEEHTRGYFGTLRAGYGTDEYYNGHGNINFFKDNTQLSIIGGLNNVDQRLYGWQDMNTLQSFEIQPFNHGENFTWWNSGIKTRKGVGANLHFRPTKGMKTDLSYVVSNEKSVGIRESSSEVYLTENTLFTENIEQSNSNTNDHQISAKVEYESDSLNRFVFRGQYSMQDGNADNSWLTYNFIQLPEVINSGVNKENALNRNSRMASKLHWTRKSKKNSANHFLGSVYIGGSDLTNDQSSYFNTVNSVILPYPSNEAPLLNQNLKTKEATIAFTSAYQFEISKKLSLRPGVNWLKSEYNHSFDWIPSDGEVMQSNSPFGTIQSQNIEYFAHIIYQLDSFTSIRFVPEINQTIEDRTFTTDSTYTYSFNKSYFIPFLFIRSNKPHKYNFNFNVRARVQRPQIQRMLPVVNTSNPYNTTIGNIELQNYMDYSNNWSFRKMFGLGKSLSFYGYNHYSVNPVANKNTTTESNYTISEIQNYKNTFGAYHGGSFNWPVKAIRAQLGINVSYNYRESFFLQNELDIRAQNVDYSMGPSIQFNDFDMWSLELEYSLTKEYGIIADVKNNGFVYQELDVEFIFNPFDRLEWSSEFYLEIFGSNNAVGRRSIPLLQSEVLWTVDPQQKWSIGIKAVDIFNKNQNLWRYWGSNRFIESRNNAVQRYFMASIIYKIKKPSKEAEDSNIIIDRR